MEIKPKNKNNTIQNISFKECFEILSNKFDAFLIDFRTQPE